VRIRELQDVTGGFLGFIPLAFHPAETQLPDLPAATGLTDLKVIAVARLMLDNVDHVKAYWIQIGEKLAPVALHFGADDLVGTVTEETITHAAGAKTESGLSRAEMERMIRGAGRDPFERDAYYERVVRDGSGRVLRANRQDFGRREEEERDSLKVGKRDSEPGAPADSASPCAGATGGSLDASIASS
jgi:aminodeoxyfutalosine synthase